MREYLDMLPLPDSPAEITQWVYPSAFLILGGIVALLIAWNYVMAEGKGAKYRISVFLGLGYSVLMAVYCYIQYAYGDWTGLGILLFGILTFTLALRPLIRWNVAFSVATLGYFGVYFGVYVFANGLVDIIYPIGVFTMAFLLAVLIYTMFHFIETGVEWAGRIMNAWPVLGVLGTACIVEGILQLMDMSMFTML